MVSDSSPETPFFLQDGVSARRVPLPFQGRSALSLPLLLRVHAELLEARLSLSLSLSAEAQHRLDRPSLSLSFLIEGEGLMPCVRCNEPVWCDLKAEGVLLFQEGAAVEAEESVRPMTNGKIHFLELWDEEVFGVLPSLPRHEGPDEVACLARLRASPYFRELEE